MTIRYAVITKQGLTFTVVLVQKSLLNNQTNAEQTIHWLQTHHFHMPTALMAHDEHGVPSAYYGPGDLALLLAHVPLNNVPWQETAIAQQVVQDSGSLSILGASALDDLVAHTELSHDLLQSP